MTQCRFAHTGSLNSYDRYLSPGNDGGNRRDSGAAFGVGMGLMGEVSDESDSEDDDYKKLVAANGKNSVLYKAAVKSQPSPLVRTPSTGARPAVPPKSPSPEKSSSIQKPPPESQEKPHPLKENSIPSTPAPPYSPRTAGRSSSPMPAPIPQPARPVPAFMLPSSSPASPSRVASSGSSVTPHPLPPSTPITPLLAAPPSALGSPNVSFQDKELVPIMRGNSEDALLERSPNRVGRGKAGEDFWRRFSMVAHEAEADARRDQSSRYVFDLRSSVCILLFIFYSTWLAKTQSKTRVMSRWVWIVGIIIFCAIGAAIGLGAYLAHQRPAHSDPGVLGGKEDYSMVPEPSTASRHLPGQTPVSTTKAGGGLSRNARAISWEPVVTTTETSPTPTVAAASRKRHYNLHLRRIVG